MGTLGRRWAGRAFGTNTGNIYAEFETDAGATTGTLRFMDSELGLSQFTVAGAFDGNRIQLTGTPLAANEGVELGTLTIQGQLSPDGQIRGDWESTLGTAGTFVLHPHDVSQPVPGAAPEQLHTAVRTLGALRLYPADVRELVGSLGRDFNHPRVVATYRDRGTEVSRYADEFLADCERLGRLDYLKLGVGEPEAYGLNRNATIELDASGANEVRVQSIQESWALGKAEFLSQTLRKNQKSFVTTVRRFGLNLNMVIVLVTVALLPELSLGRRFLFLGFSFFAVIAIVRLHAKFIPNVSIYLTGMKPGLLRRSWPQILSWLIAGTSAVAASIVYGLLKNEITLQHIVKALWPWSH